MKIFFLKLDHVEEALESLSDDVALESFQEEVDKYSVKSGRLIF